MMMMMMMIMMRMMVMMMMMMMMMICIYTYPNLHLLFTIDTYCMIAVNSIVKSFGLDFWMNRWIGDNSNMISHLPITILLVISTPLTNMSQLGWLFPIYWWENKSHVPNHQPDIHSSTMWRRLLDRFPGKTRSVRDGSSFLPVLSSRPWREDRRQRKRNGNVDSWRNSILEFF